MHPCLCVDEIVRLIAHELVASEGKATSVALACCCKSFEEPVLDVLWQAQEELKPLLRSLSDDIWDWGGCAVSPQKCALCLFTHLLNCKVPHKTPDDSRMGSFPEVRPKDAEAPRRG